MNNAYYCSWNPRQKRPMRLISKLEESKREFARRNLPPDIGDPGIPSMISDRKFRCGKR